VTLRARCVTLRARWVTLRARGVTLRARWVTFRCADDAAEAAGERTGEGMETMETVHSPTSSTYTGPLYAACAVGRQQSGESGGGGGVSSAEPVSSAGLCALLAGAGGGVGESGVVAADTVMMHLHEQCRGSPPHRTVRLTTP
jgi:hypothetical protein